MMNNVKNVEFLKCEWSEDADEGWRSYPNRNGGEYNWNVPSICEKKL